MLEDNIIEKIKSFYELHRDECDEKYLSANAKELLKQYKEIKNEDIINSYFLKSSIVILTANQYEKNILHINVTKEKKQKIKHGIIDIYNTPKRSLSINVYFFSIGKYNILHMEAAQTGSYTIGGSADLVRFITRNEYCYPSIIFSFGLCFGIDCDQEIGDTIISKKIYPYFMSAKITESKYYVEDSNIFEVDDKLNSIIKHLGVFLNNKKKNIFYGNYITGEAVISNAEIKEILIKASANNQTVLGGEMEGYGLFKECQGFANIPCLLIKAICDWGMYKNINDTDLSKINIKDRLQAYAVDCAYKVLSFLLNDNLFEYSVYLRVVKKLFDSKDIKVKVINLPLIGDTLKKLEISQQYDSDKLKYIIVNQLECDGYINKKQSQSGVWSINI